MAYRNYHKRKIADRELHPETQMMSTATIRSCRKDR